MGGSSAAQRINCPGSLELEKKAPEQEASDFAARGSMLHAAIELLIVADPATLDDAEPMMQELVGKNLGFGEDHEITEELIDDKLRPAIKTWFDIVEEYGIDDWFIEQRVSLETVINGAFGTAYIIAKDSADRLHILDWKFGDGVPVAAEGNLGLGFYAAGALYDEDPELQEFTDKISGVVLHIVQPRTGLAKVDPRDTWETTEAWVESLVNQAVEAMDKAALPDAPLKPGSWCRWCRAKAGCSAHAAMASEALSKAPESMTAVELADALHKASLLEDWCKAVVKLAQKELESGAAVPGWKLVRGRAGARKWIDPDVVADICKKKHLKVAEMYKPRVLLSPTEMEKRHKKLYCDKLSLEVTSKAAGLTLAPDSDKRPAVTDSMSLLADAMKGAKK